MALGAYPRLLKARQVLPYLAGLFLLAWALGSLARSGTRGENLLLNSYWLLYLVYLLPLIPLGAMVLLTVFIALNWRELSSALGSGIAARRRNLKKKSWKARLIVYALFWGLAVAALYWRCGGIFCGASSTRSLNNTVTLVAGSNEAPGPDLEALGRTVGGLASIVGTEWFLYAFLGLLGVSSVIIARSVLVSLEETRRGGLVELVAVQEEGAVAVRDALKILEETAETDPRTRILASYQRMIRAASDLGASVGPDRTARELERGIGSMFMLKGRGLHELTRLFEESRYSLHAMTERDSEEAHECLLEIAGELRVVASVQA